MADHLDRLKAALAEHGLRPRCFIMRGNGGVMGFENGKTIPVAITHSGPVAGIIGGREVGAAAGLDDLITFDMGGTSSDIAVVTKGRPDFTSRGRLANYPVLLPMLDLVTIGAGGGSIAHVDHGGALKVGPRSAGSVPGPMCYGQGGEHPTVTDANIVCGRLNPDYFLAGTRVIDPELSRRGIAERVAAPLGLTVEEAALGILAIAEAHMVNAIKLATVQRGLDPRGYALGRLRRRRTVAHGGAGRRARDVAGRDPAGPRQRLGQRPAVGGDHPRRGDDQHPAGGEPGPERPRGPVPVARGRRRRRFRHRRRGPGRGDDAPVAGPSLRRTVLRDVGRRLRHRRPIRLRRPAAPTVSRSAPAAVRLRDGLQGHRDGQPQGPGIERGRGRILAAQARRRRNRAGRGAPGPVRRRRGRRLAGLALRRPAAGATLTGPAIVEYPGSTFVLPAGWVGTVDAVGNILAVKNQPQPEGTQP